MARTPKRPKRTFKDKYRRVEMKYPAGERVGECHVQHKVQYPTEEDALMDAKRIRKFDRTKMTPYLCNWCKLWHLGHESKQQERRRKLNNEGEL